jgi:hypothetical protein
MNVLSLLILICEDIKMNECIGGSAPANCKRCGGSHETNPPEYDGCCCRFCNKLGNNFSKCGCLGSGFLPFLESSSKDTSKTKDAIEKLELRLKSEESFNDAVSKTYSKFSWELMIFLECFLEGFWDDFRNDVLVEVENEKAKEKEMRVNDYIDSLKEKYGAEFDNKLAEFEKMKVDLENENIEKEKSAKKPSSGDSFVDLIDSLDGGGSSLCMDVEGHEFNFNEAALFNIRYYDRAAKPAHDLFKEAALAKLNSLFNKV